MHTCFSKIRLNHPALLLVLTSALFMLLSCFSPLILSAQRTGSAKAVGDRQDADAGQAKDLKTLNDLIKRSVKLVEREFAPNQKNLDAARKRLGGARAGSSTEIMINLSRPASPKSLKALKQKLSQAEGVIDAWRFMKNFIDEQPDATIETRIAKVRQLLDELEKDRYKFEFESPERERIKSQINIYGSDVMGAFSKSKKVLDFDLGKFCESKLDEAIEKHFVAERTHTALSSNDPAVKKEVLNEARKTFGEFRKAYDKIEKDFWERDGKIRIENGDLNREIPKLFSKLIIPNTVSMSDQDFVLMNNDFRPGSGQHNCEYQSKEDVYIRIEFRFAQPEPGTLTDLRIDGKYPRFDTLGQMRKFLVNDTQVKIREYRGDGKTDLEDFVVKAVNLEIIAKLEFDSKNNK